MKKPSSKIRDEIAKLQAQLKVAETREAERIGRIALKAGLGDLVIEENDLMAALEAVTRRFRASHGSLSKSGSGGKERQGAGSLDVAAFAAGTASGSTDQA